MHLQFKDPLPLKGDNVATYNSGHLNSEGNLFSRSKTVGQDPKHSTNITSYSDPLL